MLQFEDSECMTPVRWSPCSNLLGLHLDNNKFYVLNASLETVYGGPEAYSDESSWYDNRQMAFG